MDFYYEQSVAGKNSALQTGLYVLCWVLIAVLLIIAMLFAANALGGAPDTFTVNWPQSLGMVICLAAAGVLFFRKDYLRMEYDYILRGSDLEIYAILNRRRRRSLALIDLKHIHACGRAASARCEALCSQREVRVHRWRVQSGGYYLYYMEENMRHLALLELDDQLASLIHRQLPVGVWQNIEGESGTNASLS